MAPRPFPEEHAVALAAALDLPEHPNICYACLSFVVFALDGTEQELRRQVRRITQDLWHEGLGEIAEAAVEDARRRDVENAQEAKRDLLARGGRSATARAIVMRLAAEVGRRERITMSVLQSAHDPASASEWN
jgi:hypothetical protein